MSVSKHVSHACSSNIAIPRARGIIGRSIKQCKERAAELRDEALFKHPPANEDCPICFLPMPEKLIYCVSLPPATRSYVPIYDFAIANEELEGVSADGYYPCCGKNFVEGASTLVTISVPFVIPTEVAKQLMMVSKIT